MPKVMESFVFLLPMKIYLGLLAGLLLLGVDAQANTKSMTRSGVSEEITLNLLRSKVPQDATITDKSCREIQIRLDTSYRCTITWEEN